MSQKFLSTVTAATKEYPDEMGQPEGLNITLRPHQRRSLEFCLKREMEPQEKLSIYICDYVDEDGETRPVYYSPVLSMFSFSPIQPCRSGLCSMKWGWERRPSL